MDVMKIWVSSTTTLYITLLWLELSGGKVGGGSHQHPIAGEQKLVTTLLRDYDPSVRPIVNATQPIIVKIGLTIINILEMDEKNQILVTSVWLDQEWVDEMLMWDPEEFGGIKAVRVPCARLWTPDIVLYNNADDFSRGYYQSRAMVHHDGYVFWPTPTQLRSTCKIDVTFFPFDSQHCYMKLGSWTYTGYEVEVTNRSINADLSGFIKNGEFELVSVHQMRRNIVYSCCPEPYPDVVYFFHIRRKVLYYMLNVVLPCAMMSMLTLLVYCLPPDSGEKIGLGITVLLAFSVFGLQIAEKVPETSESVPLIGIYLTVIMGMTGFSVVMTVLVLNFHHQGPFRAQVPRWVRIFILGHIRRFLGMKFPEEMLLIPDQTVYENAKEDLKQKDSMLLISSTSAAKNSNAASGVVGYNFSTAAEQQQQQQLSATTTTQSPSPNQVVGFYNNNSSSSMTSSLSNTTPTSKKPSTTATTAVKPVVIPEIPEEDALDIDQQRRSLFSKDPQNDVNIDDDDDDEEHDGEDDVIFRNDSSCRYNPHSFASLAPHRSISTGGGGTVTPTTTAQIPNGGGGCNRGGTTAVIRTDPKRTVSAAADDDNNNSGGRSSSRRRRKSSSNSLLQAIFRSNQQQNQQPTASGDYSSLKKRSHVPLNPSYSANPSVSFQQQHYLFPPSHTEQQHQIPKLVQDNTKRRATITEEFYKHSILGGHNPLLQTVYNRNQASRRASRASSITGGFLDDAETLMDQQIDGMTAVLKQQQQQRKKSSTSSARGRRRKGSFIGGQGQGSAAGGVMSNKNILEDEVLKTLHMLISRQQLDDECEEMCNEWRQVATVVDRLLFWIFLAGNMLATILLLVLVPLVNQETSDFDITKYNLPE